MWYHLPAAQAAVNLRIGLTVLKRLCRRFGIERCAISSCTSSSTATLQSHLTTALILCRWPYQRGMYTGAPANRVQQPLPGAGHIGPATLSSGGTAPDRTRPQRRAALRAVEVMHRSAADAHVDDQPAAKAKVVTSERHLQPPVDSWQQSEWLTPVSASPSYASHLVGNPASPCQAHPVWALLLHAALVITWSRALAGRNDMPNCAAAIRCSRSASTCGPRWHCNQRSGCQRSFSSATPLHQPSTASAPRQALPWVGASTPCRVDADCSPPGSNLQRRVSCRCRRGHGAVTACDPSSYGVPHFAAGAFLGPTCTCAATRRCDVEGKMQRGRASAHTASL